MCKEESSVLVDTNCPNNFRQPFYGITSMFDVLIMHELLAVLKLTYMQAQQHEL